MEDNFLFDLNIPAEKEEYKNSKSDILRFLKDIGVDTRYVSIWENNGKHYFVKPSKVRIGFANLSKEAIKLTFKEAFTKMMELSLETAIKL